MEKGIFLFLLALGGVHTECLLDLCHKRAGTSLSCEFKPDIQYPEACDRVQLFQEVSIQGIDSTMSLLTELTAKHIGHLKVYSLTLNDLNISQLESEVFQFTSDALTRVDLSENLLPSLPESIFRNCNLLTSLNLSLNKLTRVPSSALIHVPQLTQLNLAGNQIRAILDEDFQFLTQLYKLDVSYNQLEQLVPSSIPLSNLAEFALTGNHLTCDCNLAWLRDIEECLCVFEYGDCPNGSHSLVDFSVVGCMQRNDIPVYRCDVKACNESATETESALQDSGEFFNRAFGD